MTSLPRTVGNSITRALFITVAFALSRAELPERRPDLSPHQDAWKALTAPGRYYLYMRSYEEEPFYGLNRKCVFNDLISVNEKEKYTTNIFGSTDPKDGSVMNATVYAWARATDGYATPNVIESSTSLEKKMVVEYAVAFSEYDNCDILRIPHRSNGCELWAKAGEVDKVKPICFFLFHLLCGPEKYIVYDKDLCEKNERLQFPECSFDGKMP
ncbi:female-specific histamine-binding protein 2-like [Dermacentor variabilis]|uniref:female-specific histamine-binding protein 2-like n=1 Tax=Dermacentor variabilis TaxID=34621 RepID=UPI003F5C2A30